jgi:biopolymer transport protein ExbD
VEKTDYGALDILLKIIDTSIQNGSPPEVKEAFDRLTAPGLTEQEAKLEIARVYVNDLRKVHCSEQKYDRTQFTQALLNIDKPSDKEKSIRRVEQEVPHNISDLLKVALPTAGAAKLVIELIRSWVKDREGRKIKIKSGDYELEIEGGVSNKQIEDRLSQFKEHSKDKDIDIEIVESNKEDELRPEYDFSQMKGGVRGKYVDRYRNGTNLVLLDPDVAAAFPDAKAVNDALRLLLQEKHSPQPR